MERPEWVEQLLGMMRADSRWERSPEYTGPPVYIRPPRNELSPPPPFREDEDLAFDFGETESQLGAEEEEEEEADGADPGAADDSLGHDEEDRGEAEEAAPAEEVTADLPSIVPDDVSDTSSHDYDPDRDRKRWQRRQDELNGTDEMNDKELDSYRWGPPAFPHCR